MSNKVSDLKNFCILPFIHLATTTEGNVRLCCKVNRKKVAVKNNNEKFNIAKDSVTEIWNSDYMNEARQKILNDERLPECEICWKEEVDFDKDWTEVGPKQFLPSKRMKENIKWQDALTRSFDEIVTNPQISYFDIRLNNLCNLKCRMCWPQFSSQIVKEQQQFQDTNQPTWYKDLTFDKIDDISVFWKSLEDNIFEVKEITFVGGEPTLHDEMYDLLDNLVEKDYAKQITLKMTTNLTNLQPRLLAVINKFERVIFNLSIDGTEKVNEYIRYPSKWEVLSTNLAKLLEQDGKQVTINISYVVQIYNVFDVFDMAKWYIEQFRVNQRIRYNFNLSFDFLYDPSRLSIKILNNQGKKAWFEEYTKWKQYYKNLMDNIDNEPENVKVTWYKIDRINKDIVKIGKHADVLIPNEEKTEMVFNALPSNLTEDQHGHKAEQRIECEKYTEQLDAHRGQSILDIFPKFYEYIFTDDNK
jgi:organic radical activating enzyme